VTTHPLLIVCAALPLAMLLWMAALLAIVLATDAIAWHVLDYLLRATGA